MVVPIITGNYIHICIHVGAWMTVSRQSRQYKDYASNPISASFLLSFFRLCYEISGNSTLQ